MKKKLLIAAIAALLCLCACAALALGETRTITVTGSFGQSEARSMLSLINAFRTGGDAWYWNSDDTTRTQCAGLSPLVYDYELEKAAMQRAIEIAVYYSHTRPNGGRCFTACPGGYSSMGENIAAGYGMLDDSASAFDAWREEDRPYSGQGHRRNMLNSGFNRIGIGHVVFNGRHFWTQELGRSSSSAASGGAADGERQMSVEIDLDNVSGVSAAIDSSALEVAYGESVSLPAEARVTLTETWGGAFRVGIDSGWTAADAAVAGVSGSSLSGEKAGSTSVSATLLGRTLTVPVTVRPASLSTAQVAVSGGGFVYDASAHTPQVTVIRSGVQLRQDADYAVSYEDNVDAGTATVRVTGRGNYADSAAATFKIAPASLSGAAIGAIGAATYTGGAVEPEIPVAVNGRALAAGTDYTVRYGDNVNAGTATATLTGVGNYAGTASAAFAIEPVDISRASCAGIPAARYTGEAIRPALSITYARMALQAGTDYTATYGNNLNAGVARIAVEGVGNFTGAAEYTFTIEPVGLSECAVDPIPAQRYTGETVAPAVSIAYRGTALAQGTDFTAVYSNNVEAGSARVALSGVGNFTGRLERAFAISEAIDGRYTDGDGCYKIESNGAATYLKPARSAKSVSVPDKIRVDGRALKVTAIADKAFRKDGKLASVTIGKYVKTIGKSAFQGCGRLKTVKGGAAVTEIREAAFRDCRALKAITLNGKLKKLGRNAFYGCKALKKITVRTARLTAGAVGANAFKGIAASAVFECPGKKRQAYEALFKKRGAPKTASYR